MSPAPVHFPAEENERLAFAPGASSATRIAETLVALANGAGGTLLVGVDPRTGRPDGLEGVDQAMDRALHAALSTEPPLIIPLPRLARVEGGAFLELTVPPGLHVYGYRGRYLVRSGAANVPLQPQELHRLMTERGTAGFESLVPDGAGAADLDWARVERYLSALVGLATLDRTEALLVRGCLARQGEAVRPTIAGLLLFGYEPQRWVRSSRIMVARYAGRSMSDRFVKEEITGTLPEQIRRAEAFVSSHVGRGVWLSGTERMEQGEYPLEAIREAIVNAVAHRDYQVRGDEIRILLFGDRIEFYSPGRLPGHITVENLVDERFSRNEVIVQVLSDMGFIERLGYGIDRILRLSADAGLPAPRFEQTAAGFLVTLHGRGTGPAVLSHDAQRWRLMGLNERQEAALAYLGQRGRITNREYQDLCPDVSAETLRRDLADLASKGLLIRIGEKRATYYILK